MRQMSEPIVLNYSADKVPSELKPMLKILSGEYPISTKVKSGIKLEFVKSGEKNLCDVTLKNNFATIHYGQISLAARGLGSLLSGTMKNNSELTERSPFESFGIMLDCSRNAVMTVDHFKKWLRQLSLMGYNSAMLYTEDTYEIDGEKFFGFMRGAYTAAELMEIDSYALALGIEMIPCIQTLGHLEQILKWPIYTKLKDTPSVLLTNNKESYKLIEKMLEQCLNCFKSRRMHIGMDEAHDIGRGKYMDLFGHKSGFEVFNEHLAILEEMCKKRGIKPMIWSDMYFRMGSKNGDYYDSETVIPEEVKNKIPQEVELVYWDYYHEEKDFYDDWIEKHRALGFDPIMGSGIWTWRLFWQNQNWTERKVGPCIESCVEKGIKEIYFTIWGDDGGYCDFDSAMSGLLWAADKAFCKINVDKSKLGKRFNAICKGDYNAKLTVSEIFKDDFNTPLYLMWDDPLLNINILGMMCFYRQPNRGELSPFEAINLQVKNLNKVADKLKKYSNDHEGGDISYALTFIKMLAAKLELSAILLEAYSRDDKKGLQKVREIIPVLIKRIITFDKAFRKMWLSHNKPFGLETIQIRNAGILRRVKELDTRLSEYLNKEIDTIPELDEVMVSINSITEKSKMSEYPLMQNYRQMATASSIL